MAWLKLRLHRLRPEQIETLEDALLGLGAQAVTLEDAADEPVLEPGPGATPLWSSSEFTALFPAATDIEAVVQALQAQLPLPAVDVLPDWSSDLLEDKDWVRAWMDHYHPISFGERLWICPSWQAPPDPDAVNLMLDPGLAFGTGTHPTTALCMRWLNDQAAAGGLQDSTVLDFGCGSGVLGIAALLLGARRLVGVDIDPQAVTSTRQNADRNGIDPARYAVMLPDALPADTEADVVLANILAGPLIDLAPTLLRHLRPGGWIVLSGVIRSQVEEVCAAYDSELTEMTVSYQDDWARISGRRTDTPI
ncbi:50S ribosomal protein L11 methyltransferase [Natronospirillum operosum]|uniref:Ribosomal protein L11 methyltransferase n=1 Tax=Natronospirillum operosum TaxID=2759953 RepID=A0A4Z0WEA9_9GAMM|nr:50S ribosomal protein L11 methyltransferase [Natronospirillum operosum]TGG94988.1 50S ribosomal protein L11 methyltransferase [Natronospirillum operosum]